MPWAIIQDTVRGENIGGVGGFVHAVANCAGIIGPAVTGFIVQATGTSVDHGTAFDIAGTGQADERSLLEALHQAVELVPRRGATVQAEAASPA